MSEKTKDQNPPSKDSSPSQPKPIEKKQPPPVPKPPSDSFMYMRNDGFTKKELELMEKAENRYLTVLPYERQAIDIEPQSLPLI